MDKRDLICSCLNEEKVTKKETHGLAMELAMLLLAKIILVPKVQNNGSGSKFVI
jgi:hypothetical protein